MSACICVTTVAHVNSDDPPRCLTWFGGDADTWRRHAEARKSETFCRWCGKWTRSLLGTTLCYDCGGRK